MNLDLHALSMTALIELENGLEKQPLRIVNATNSKTKMLEISMLMEEEELAKPMDEVKQKIIVPATFALVNAINKLGPSWNTMVRISPESDKCNWSRIELSNISVIVLKGFDLKEDCVTLQIAVQIAEDKNWKANEWIKEHYTPIDKTHTILIDAKVILIYGEWFEVSNADYQNYLNLRVEKDG